MVPKRCFAVAAAVLTLLAGCGGDDKGSSPTTIGRTTTTTTTTTTTATSTTTTIAAPTTSQAASPPDCSSRPASGGVWSVAAPADGVYRFVSCRNGTPAFDIAVGAGDSAAQRRVTDTYSFGSVTGLHDYGSAVTQASATVRPKGATTVLGCTWDQPLTIYPAALSATSTWRADARCSMDFGQSLQVNRSSRAVGVRLFNVGAKPVRVLVIEEAADVLYVNNPRRTSTTWHAESTVFLDPARGMVVYVRRTVEAMGQYPQSKATVEALLAG